MDSCGFLYRSCEFSQLIFCVTYFDGADWRTVHAVDVYLYYASVKVG